jgi:hypothetical protein
VLHSVPVVPSSVHGIEVVVDVGQLNPLHDVPHETSHAHELEQSMAWQPFVPLQVTLHGPLPQVMSLHALFPLHVTSHDAALEQSMSSHALFWAEHVIVQ